MRRKKFAVVNVEHLRCHAQPFCNFRGFRRTTFGERSASHLPMPDFSVGDRNQFDSMSHRSPERRCPATFVLRIVRVSSEADDVQFSVVQSRNEPTR